MAIENIKSKKWLHIIASQLELPFEYSDYLICEPYEFCSWLGFVFRNTGSFLIELMLYFTNTASFIFSINFIELDKWRNRW
jgi:hypothetical protein